ncbi:hypothetical protein GCM10009799_01220 [Nocardiopsis rhodophaea]|uniref:Uncharacterized protein n=1 Tax=Nocardiopsis rhodophaea TaxID=280238 RepID=A0ABN2S426_9ACTN
MTHISARIWARITLAAGALLMLAASPAPTRTDSDTPLCDADREPLAAIPPKSARIRPYFIAHEGRQSTANRLFAEFRATLVHQAEQDALAERWKKVALR